MCRKCIIKCSYWRLFGTFHCSCETSFRAELPLQIPVCPSNQKLPVQPARPRVVFSLSVPSSWTCWAATHEAFCLICRLWFYWVKGGIVWPWISCLGVTEPDYLICNLKCPLMPTWDLGHILWVLLWNNNEMCVCVWIWSLKAFSPPAVFGAD